MAKPLRVLLVEDTERDAALLKLHLRRGGYDVVLERVETRVELETQLAAATWDVVLSDFNLPTFDAFAALEVVRASGSQVPFIVLSGDVSPAVRAEITAAGSRYVPKHELPSLLPILAELLGERP